MDDARRYLRLCILLLGTTTLARILIASFLGLGVDEAHYYQYAMHPALSYYDHPPLVGWLIRLCVTLLGRTYLAVRIPGLAAGAAVMVLLFIAGTRLYDARTGFWTAVVLNVLPMFSAVGCVMAVPDTLLSAVWLVVMLLVHRIRDTGRAWLWYAAGMGIGLALLSKYTAVLLYPAVLFFLLADPRMRPWLKRKEPWLAVALSLLVFSPVLAWNYQHYWVSFGFQLRHGFSAAVRFRPSVPLKNVGAAAGALSPFLFPFIVAAVFRLLSGLRERKTEVLLQACFALPVLGLFAAAGFFNKVLPHWPAVGYLSLLPLCGSMVGYMVRHPSGSSGNTAWKSGYAAFAVATGALMTILVPAQAILRFLPLPAGMDPTADLIGWPEVSERIRDIRVSRPEETLPVFTHKFYLASQLSFHMPVSEHIYCLSPRVDQYDFWQMPGRIPSLAGRDGIFFCDEHFRADPATLYAFRRIESEPPLEIRYRGRPVKRVFFYRCYGLDGAATPSGTMYSLPYERPRAISAAAAEWNRRWFFRINGLAGRSAAADMFVAGTGWLGSGYVLVPLIAAVLWKTRRRRFWRLMAVFIFMAVCGGIMVNVLKRCVTTPRPLRCFGPELVRVIGPRLMSGSFPSGHAQTVFAGVLFLSWVLPRPWPVFWLLGTVAAVSRCYVGAHFPADILGGFVVALIAYVAGRALFGKEPA